MNVKRNVLLGAIVLLSSTVCTTGLFAQNQLKLTNYSSVINDAGFESNDGSWTVEPLYEGYGTGFKVDGNGNNNCAEIWNTESKVHQTIEGLQEGYYLVKMQGFFRNGELPDDMATAHYAFLYANDSHVPLRFITSGAKAEAVDGYTNTKWGYLPNTQQTAAVAFANGDYPNELVTYVGSDGILELGVLKYGWDGTWAVFDKFELYYINTHDNVVAAGSEPFYLRNVATGKFLDAGESWGTSAIANNVPLDITSISIPGTDKYLLNTGIQNSGGPEIHFLRTDYWGWSGTDNGTFVDSPATLWSMENVEGNKYVLSPNYGLVYLGCDGNNNNLSARLTDKNDPNAQVEMLTREDLIDEIKTATQQNPADATFLLTDPQFRVRDTRVSAWNGLGDNDVDGHVDASCANYVAQIWDKNSDIYQILENVPNGYYKIKVQGFYRSGEGNEGYARNAYLYANEESTPLLNISAGASADDPGDDYTWYQQTDAGWIPARMNSAAKEFDKGKYQSSTITVHVTDNTLRVGVRENADIWMDWTVFDNFEISYYGSIHIEDNAEKFEQLQDEEYYNISYTRNFKNTNWQALYVPFEIPVTEELLNDFEIAYIYDARQYDRNDDGVKDETIIEAFRVKDGLLNANYPYLIRAKVAGEKTIAVSDATLYRSEDKHIDCSSVFDTYTFTGTSNRMPSYLLTGCYALSGGVWQPIADGASLGAFRMYLKIDSRDGNTDAARSINMRVDDEDGYTGIEELESVQGTQQATIVYDMQGRRINDTDNLKGIYIVNGKKVIK